jgi:hypothetical protein
MKSGNSSHNETITVPTVWGEHRIVLNEESFHAMISLERKRSERSQRPFLLMLLDVSRLLTSDKNGKKLGAILTTLYPSIQWMVQKQFCNRHCVQRHWEWSARLRC